MNPALSEEEHDEDDWLASWELAAGKAGHAAQACWSGILCAAGAIACLYGRSFPYSVCFWRSFCLTGWPRARPALCELWRRSRAAVGAARRELPPRLLNAREASGAARELAARVQAAHAAHQAAQTGGDPAAQALSMELQALQEEMPLLRQAGSAAAAAAAELEPQRALELLTCLYDICIATLAAALKDGASLVGAHASIGDTIAVTVNHAVIPRLHAAINVLAAHSGEELRELREDSLVGAWIVRAVGALCSCVGVAASMAAESVVLTVANARVGAQIIAHELIHWLARVGSPTLGPHVLVPLVISTEWLLCAGGLYWQLVLGTGGVVGFFRRLVFGSSPIPMALRWALGVPLLAEGWLHLAVATRRSGLFVT